MVKSQVRLSQCMIVKNEEQNIAKALSWGKDVVYEQIVVDTGSTDRTVEIAESMGAKVVHFEWINDFAAAKNFAIEQAKGNWIALLDADEFFPEEDTKKLMKLLEQAHPDRRVDIIRTKWVHLNSDGSVKGVSCQDRVFRNGNKVRYRFRIHEELYGQNDQHIALYDAQNELMILHTGYGTESNLPEKGMRNAKMLERDLKEYPNNGKRLMYLGDAYNIADMQEKAIACYRRVLWDPQVDREDAIGLVRAAMQLMSLIADKPAEEIRDEYQKIKELLESRGLAGHPDLDYYTGFLNLKEGKAEEAAACFERALKNAEVYADGDVIRMASNLKLPNWVIAAMALQKGQLQKAVQFAVSALQADKYCPEGINVLLQAFLAEWKPGKPAEPYLQFLLKLYDAGNLKDLLFIRKFAADSGFMALQECLDSVLPPEVLEQL